jgi:hypothetical protein
MLGVKRAVWLATQAIRNNAGHPKLASHMCMLFLNEPLFQSALKTITALLRFAVL